jgi:ferric-dicitrate binding protein FerR (iron transport regulator)
MDHRINLAQDLLENPRFVAWVSGEAPQDDAYWLHWIGQDKARQEAAEQARAILVILTDPPVQLSEPYIDASIRQALTDAKRQERQAPVRRNWYVIPVFRWAVAAAAVIILGLFGLYWLNQPASTESPGRTTTELVKSPLRQKSNRVDVVNRTDAVRYVNLPDGSSVILQRNSRIVYPKSFAGLKREVYLTGAAFFEVTKNPAKPFFVHTDKLTAKVVGTSFSVKAFTGQPSIEVLVKTGKVTVFSTTSSASQTRAKPAEVVLLPNQQAVFNREENTLSRSAIQSQKQERLPIEHNAFDYEDTPVTEVFAQLEQTYGVDIVYDKAVMSHCSITATLGDEPLANKLKWICRILEASYEFTPSQIIITGKPCQ